MSNLIANLIYSFSGYNYEVVGMVAGFFDTPEQASACAIKIRATLGLDVEVCGNQLTVWL